MSEQLPLVVGAKLSILDVRCKDHTGTTFVVEMQLVHVPQPQGSDGSFYGREIAPPP